ncbi:MAG: trigger factor [Patescibacteria group bacterium]|nr:trigger factor [Patescibacteria group bacterium]
MPKNTAEVEVVLPASYLKKQKEEAFSRLQKELVVEGFRKGKVPSSIAKKHLKDEQILEEALRKILPEIYSEIVKKESLSPIYNPKIEFVKAKDGEDWQIKITIALRPAINLKDYKKIVKDIKAKEKKPDIWVPGKDKEKKPEEKDSTILLNKILEALLKEVEIEISDLILDEELNHRLALLVDDIRKIGLTTEDYLKSKNTTMDQLKNSYRKEIEDTYKLEFILNEIADKENIKVETSDLEKIFSSITDEKQKEIARQNSYYYASILRKQKTLDYLIIL